MVGRSREVTGPYGDAEGKKMTEGAAMPLLRQISNGSALVANRFCSKKMETLSSATPTTRRPEFPRYKSRRSRGRRLATCGVGWQCLE
jgi:beta-xylosidase